MREIIMPMEDKDFDLLAAATAEADPDGAGWTEIVRCAECAHWMTVNGVGPTGRYCPIVLHCTDRAFFCADGKRKTED